MSSGGENVVWTFLKKSWQYIVLAVGIIVAYLVYMDPERISYFDYRDGKLEGKSEAEESKRKRAEQKKDQARKDLDGLKKEEKELRDKLAKTPQHRDKSKEELREFMRRNYGKK